mmetsp:Transcript_5827/g.14538  ORF Transcript_5827/g.14538 Transcript_5827/m.14538 type:complete len:203 (+) Transcript_5827:2875-3483(+)
MCNCSSVTLARKETSSGTCIRYRVCVIRAFEINRCFCFGRSRSCGVGGCGTTCRSTTSSMRSARAFITIGESVWRASPNKCERLTWTLLPMCLVCAKLKPVAEHHFRMAFKPIAMIRSSISSASSSFFFPPTLDCCCCCCCRCFCCCFSCRFICLRCSESCKTGRSKTFAITGRDKRWRTSIVPRGDIVLAVSVYFCKESSK